MQLPIDILLMILRTEELARLGTNMHFVELQPFVGFSKNQLEKEVYYKGSLLVENGNQTTLTVFFIDHCPLR